MEPTDTPDGGRETGAQGSSSYDPAAYPQPSAPQPQYQQPEYPQPDYQQGYAASGYEQQQPGYQTPTAFPQQPDYQHDSSGGYALPGYEPYAQQGSPGAGYGQPPYQQPGYQQGYVPGAHPPPPGQPGAGQPGGPARSRRKLYVILGAAAVVVVLLVVGGIFLFGGGGSKGKSPEATVTEYLNDLAGGQASAALALGDPPASKTFLTAAILKKQQQQAKISKIKTIGTEYGNDGTHDRSRVHVTYAFGSQNADEYYTMTKIDGKWVLDDTTLSISISSSIDIPGLALFGVPVKGQQKLYVFPGPLKFTSTDSNFAVTDRSKTFATSPSDYVYPELSAALSNTGKQAVQKAVAAAMQQCAESHSLAPENCPNHEFGTSGLPVADSAEWTAPTDYSGLQYQIGYDNPSQIRVSGQLVFKVSYKTEDYVTVKVTTQTDEVKGLVFGTVDLSKSPVTFVTE
jgi:hypothetical protein